MNRIQIYIEMSGVDVQNGWVGNFFIHSFRNNESEQHAGSVLYTDGKSDRMVTSG